MKIAIVQFPGSNCERETMLAVKRADMQPLAFLWNEPLEKLRAMHGFIIVGGFSYEDRGRAGIIAALQPVMQEIKAQSELGKPILGICNGAQILVETGLVPGLENHQLALALTQNKRMAQGQVLGSGFYNAWVHMRVADHYQRNAFTRHLHPKKILSLPVAHGEGRFMLTPALLQEVVAQGLHVFQYCDQQGQIVDSFPTNPNGSMLNIAALANKAGNVLAIMPHPERTPEGDVIFQSMRDYLLEELQVSASVDTPSRLQRNLGRYAATEQKSNQLVDTVTPLYYYPRAYQIRNYVKPEGAHEWLVKLLITDNAALTVSQTLRQLGWEVEVKRAEHWEIQTSSEELSLIQKSAVLFNDRKEKLITKSEWHAPDTISYLVRAKEDMLSQEKIQLLKDHFSLAEATIQYGVLWQFTSKHANIADFITDILKTNIVFNPYAYDCYQY